MGRIRHLTSLVRRELRQLQAERATGGVEYAVRRRLAHHSGVNPLRAEIESHGAALDALRLRLTAAEEQGPELARLSQALREHSHALDALGGRIGVLEPLAAQQEERHQGLHQRVRRRASRASRAFSGLNAILRPEFPHSAR